MQRRVVAMCLAVVLSVLLFGCLSGDNGKQETNTEETVSFDLSQYKSYGEVSDGRIWVIKETADWNTDPYESYAYMDQNGKVIYGWHRIGTYFEPDISTYVRDTRPQDFKNGYALIFEPARTVRLGLTDVTIIDKTGSVVARLMVKASYRENMDQWAYREFNKEGHAFFVGKRNYDEELGLLFVNSTGVHQFQLSKNHEAAEYLLDDIDVVNGRYLYVSGCSSLFDQTGKLLVDFKESCDISPKSVEIVNDSYIEAYFTGKDSKQYVCIVDFEGNMRRMPVLRGEYQRDENLSYR